MRILFLCLICFLAACSKEPVTYDECITSALQNVKSDVGAKAMIDVCKRKFQEAKPIEPARETAASCLAKGKGFSENFVSSFCVERCTKEQLIEIKEADTKNEEILKLQKLPKLECSKSEKMKWAEVSKTCEFRSQFPFEGKPICE